MENKSKTRIRKQKLLSLVFLFSVFVMFGMVSVVRVFAQEQVPPQQAV